MGIGGAPSRGGNLPPFQCIFAHPLPPPLLKDCWVPPYAPAPAGEGVGGGRWWEGARQSSGGSPTARGTLDPPCLRSPAPSCRGRRHGVRGIGQRAFLSNALPLRPLLCGACAAGLSHRLLRPALSVPSGADATCRGPSRSASRALHCLLRRLEFPAFATKSPADERERGGGGGQPRHRRGCMGARHIHPEFRTEHRTTARFAAPTSTAHATRITAIDAFTFLIRHFFASHVMSFGAPSEAKCPRGSTAPHIVQPAPTAAPLHPCTPAQLHPGPVWRMCRPCKPGVCMGRCVVCTAVGASGHRSGARWRGVHWEVRIAMPGPARVQAGRAGPWNARYTDTKGLRWWSAVL